MIVEVSAPEREPCVVEGELAALDALPCPVGGLARDGVVDVAWRDGVGDFVVEDGLEGGDDLFQSIVSTVSLSD